MDIYHPVPSFVRGRTIYATTARHRIIGEAEASPVPEMLTPQQAADYLGVKVSTLAV